MTRLESVRSVSYSSATAVHLHYEDSCSINSEYSIHGSMYLYAHRDGLTI
jgi:hypothetical protein